MDVQPAGAGCADRAAIWRGVQNGTFQMVTSDHAPYRFDASGKLANGPDPDFKQIANGIPGIELRLPLLFSEGVGKGRIDLERFVELGCTNPARIYGLHPKKGTIAIGSDADLAIWDPEQTVEITDQTTHDATGYCPYAGHDADRLADHGDRARRGDRRRGRASGRARPRPLPAARRRRGGDRPGLLVPEMDPAQNFGAELLD